MFFWVNESCILLHHLKLLHELAICCTAEPWQGSKVIFFAPRSKSKGLCHTQSNTHQSSKFSTSIAGSVLQLAWLGVWLPLKNWTWNHKMNFSSHTLLLCGYFLGPGAQHKDKVKPMYCTYISYIIWYIYIYIIDCFFDNIYIYDIIYRLYFIYIYTYNHPTISYFYVCMMINYWIKHEAQTYSFY